MSEKLPFSRVDWKFAPEDSARSRAVQIALFIMAHLRLERWDQVAEVLAEDPELAAELRSSLSLSKGLAASLDEYEYVLLGLRRKQSKGKRSSVTVSIIECPTCGRWGFQAGAATPKKCQWTRGCEGVVTRVADAAAEPHR